MGRGLDPYPDQSSFTYLLADKTTARTFLAIGIVVLRRRREAQIQSCLGSGLIDQTGQAVGPPPGLKRIGAFRPIAGQRLSLAEYFHR